MQRELSELQKQILDILEDYGGYTNRGCIRHKIWPSLFPANFIIWDILRSPISERSIQERNATISLKKSLKGLEKRGLVKLGSFYPYSVAFPKIKIFMSSNRTNKSEQFVILSDIANYMGMPPK